MRRFKVSLLAACGLLVLAAVLGAIGPKRALAALGYTPVRDVDNVGRQPFALEAVVPFGGNASFTVPANKRLVITAVSGNTFGPADINVNIVSNVGGTATNHVVPYTTPGSNSVASLAGEALAHANPGTTVAVSSTGPDGAVITAVGYYVDVP